MSETQELMQVKEGQISRFSFNEMAQMAKVVSDSGLFGMNNEAQALSLLLLCDAQGLHPMKAVQKYHIIQNRPSMKSEAMLADFQAAGGKVQWVERSNNAVKAIFSFPGRGDLEVEWTIQQAAQIKDSKSGKSLADKDNWQNYPRQMLTARVVSEGIRTLCPEIVQGVYTPEEIMDFAPQEKEVNPAPKNQQNQSSKTGKQGQDNPKKGQSQQKKAHTPEQMLEILKSEVEKVRGKVMDLSGLRDRWQAKKESLPEEIFKQGYGLIVSEILNARIVAASEQKELEEIKAEWENIRDLIPDDQYESGLALINIELTSQVVS